MIETWTDRLLNRFAGGTYLRFHTMFGKTRVYQVEDDDGEPVRLLEVGGIVQSGTRLGDEYAELVFEYLKRYDVMFEGPGEDAGGDPMRGREVRDVAVLGCGGYDYPKHLIAHHPETRVDAVEIDPAITEIARRHFFLDRLIEEFETERTGRLNLVCADALDFLRSTDAAYDAIVNDCFDAGTPPVHLATPEFLEAARLRLRPGGLYLVNVVAPLEGPGATFLNECRTSLETAFGNARVIPCDPDALTEPDNVILVAAR